ncbi:MAG: AAA family ATPase, partial [Bacteroidales bacterium]|nr:AAA family ATPase [Bacteroidales bacterium]
MKLLKLTIHNIASIENAVIDFAEGPLADDTRFLICGPLGSGKTTILDAICLALYNTTPRLKNASNESYT